MGSEKAINRDHIGVDWAIFVVHAVLDWPGRNSYQRLLALASEFNVLVVTNTALPPLLDRKVQGVFVVNGSKQLWAMALKVGRDLKSQGRSFYVHTQYSSAPAIAGFLCKRKLGCSWIYDLWDHPSLNFSMRRGIARWARQFVEAGVRRLVLTKADAWIIAMHPAILRHMPPAPITCKLIFTRPGILPQRHSDVKSRETERGESKPIKIIYVGPVTQQRLNIICIWLKGYSGPEVDLQFIGPLANDGEECLDQIEQLCLKNIKVSCQYHGEIAHEKVIEILKKSDIGICPLETSVLNYRFAFPIKIVEQMHLGLVVVASDSHGVSSYITDGVNGILITSESDGVQKAFDRAIGIVIDPASRERVAEAAIKTVENDTWSRRNKRLVALIKEVVDRH